MWDGCEAGEDCCSEKNLLIDPSTSSLVFSCSFKKAFYKSNSPTIPHGWIRCGTRLWPVCRKKGLMFVRRTTEPIEYRQVDFLLDNV